MRKIDALLMSVLILYDFGAQSIVDTKTTSFGQTFEIARHAVRGKKATTNPLDAATVNYNINSTASKETVTSNSSKIDVKQSFAKKQFEAKLSSAALQNADLATTNTNSEVATSNTEEKLAAQLSENSSVATTQTESLTDNSKFRDSDADGIFDGDDKCPNQSGVARFEGCPVPDTDGDGVNDEEDRCPVQAGITSNWGCPVKETADLAAENVQETESSFLASKSVQFSINQNVLDNDNFNIVLQLAEMLINDPMLKVEINGYADNQGSEISNKKLSVSSATSVADYLKGLGVHEDQIHVKGLGASKAIAANDNADGKGSNSRVELHLKY